MQFSGERAYIWICVPTPLVGKSTWNGHKVQSSDMDQNYENEMSKVVVPASSMVCAWEKTIVISTLLMKSRFFPLPERKQGLRYQLRLPVWPPLFPRLLNSSSDMSVCLVLVSPPRYKQKWLLKNHIPSLSFCVHMNWTALLKWSHLWHYRSDKHSPFSTE